MSEQEKFPGVTHYTHVDVQPGGINIQHVEHLHQADVLQALGIELEVKRTKQTGDTETACPPQLDTPQARGLWQKAIAEGWVDERRQPLLSRPMAALLADRMATVLDITAKWKVFEQMWHRKNMRNDYNTALEQQQCDEYRKKFARVIR
jgi:hypothetical protein